jgi:penicillin-binding protein-related factor A (putative recombinase)
MICFFLKQNIKLKKKKLRLLGPSIKTKQPRYVGFLAQLTHPSLFCFSLIFFKEMDDPYI